MKIISWILRSVDQQIVRNLRPHKISKKMWEYLKKIYNQDNSARQFRLEHEISEYCQGNKSIQDDYSRFLNLWMGFEDLVYQLFLKTVSLLCKNITRDQFLMKLSNEFENVWANLMSRKPIPSLDECLGELLQEEQCCLIKATMEQKGSAASHLDEAYSTQAKPRDKKNPIQLKILSILRANTSKKKV